METCQNCGETVSKSFVRVFGGNDDRIRVCHDRSTMGDIVRGGSALPVD